MHKLLFQICGLNGEDGGRQAALNADLRVAFLLRAAHDEQGTAFPRGDTR